MTAIAKQLDVQGLSCPMPILRTKKALAGMAQGEVLEVLATDPGSWEDMAYYCKNTAHVLLERSNEGAVYRYLIQA